MVTAVSAICSCSRLKYWAAAGPAYTSATLLCFALLCYQRTRLCIGAAVLHYMAVSFQLLRCRCSLASFMLLTRTLKGQTTWWFVSSNLHLVQTLRTSNEGMSSLAALDMLAI